MHVVRIQSRICVGGPALHTILLSEGLSKTSGSRYETTLVGGTLEPGEHPMDGFAAQRGVRIHQLADLRRAVHPARDAKALASLSRLLREKRPAIVHTHTAKAGAIGRVAAKISNVPIVVHTFHGHVFEGYFGGPKTKAFVAAERGLARLSDCVIAISERQRDELVERYRVAPRSKVRVIPLGLDLDRFRAVGATERGALRRELGLDEACPLVVSVGRLVDIKRFDLLIDAFGRVAARHPTARLLLVGDGDAAMRKSLEERARRTSDRITFLGLRRDLEQIHADADLFVLSSDNEGTPVAAIEALAAGVRVVATDVGGLRDLLSRETGVLVSKGQVLEIAEAMAAELEQVRRLPDHSRDAIVRRYSHHRLIRDVTSLYDELLEAKGHRRAPARAVREGAVC